MGESGIRDRNKHTAFEDAIDVAKALVRGRVTRPGRIGVTSGSCGGMTMDMAALEAPHLNGAAVLSAGADYTIPLWVGGKVVARARAANPEGKPVLWDIQWQGGHNAGIDYVQLDTDQMAFLFWQPGHPDFQP